MRIFDSALDDCDFVHHVADRLLDRGHSLFDVTILLYKHLNSLIRTRCEIIKTPDCIGYFLGDPFHPISEST